MADAQTTTIHIGEILILAGRLLARGSSMLDTDRPEQQQDLRLAARVIRASVRSFNSGDVVTL